MKKVLIAASVILLAMVFVGSASATVSISGQLDCVGSSPNEICIITVVCSNAPCNVTGDPVTQTNATCTSNLGLLEASVEFRAVHLDAGTPSPVCEWTVEDADPDSEIAVRIDGGDGLPVELTWIERFGSPFPVFRPRSDA